MSKRNTGEHVNIWKKVPHRIKSLLKKDRLFDPTSPPPLSVYTKQKSPSSLLYRIFSTRNKSETIIQLKEHQWNNPTSDVTELELYTSPTEVPMRANLLSFFNPSQHQQPQQQQQQQQQQHGWSNKSSTMEEFSKLYMATLQKIRLFNHYTMEQQIDIHHMLSKIQNQQHRPLLCRGAYQRDFNSILSGRSMMTDSILLNNNRKPRRTRYIFMLLSTPTIHVINKIHPVTNALSKLRKPYAETYSVVDANENDSVEDQKEEKPLPVPTASKKSFIPANYLLDPATLFCSDINATETNHHRLGTKFNGSTVTTTPPKTTTIATTAIETATTTKPSASSEHYDLKNIMAKIQIQTN